jgi:4a-hydroxytetrahydrobiopterin dehydratase
MKLLSHEEVAEYFKNVPGWTLVEEEDSITHIKVPKKITRSWKFPDFVQSLAFANKVSEIAEQEGHHPDLLVSWGKVGVELSTHDVGGLSEKDFIVAEKIDEL